jgi:hypothetical protein
MVRLKRHVMCHKGNFCRALTIRDFVLPL